jgi:molybdate transport system permease protein
VSPSKVRTTLGFALLLGLLLWFFVWAAPSRGDDDRERVTVFAAASLTDAMTELAARFEANHPAVHVVPIFGPTSTLARQIESGSPADLFLSADISWMDHLESRDLIRADSRSELLGNRLVLIVPVDSGDVSVDDLGNLDRLAIADPEAVPAGRYARTALERLGVWEVTAGRRVIAPDVRVAVAYVARGEVDGAIVYRSDARASSEVRVAAELPDNVQPDITYAWAGLGGSPTSGAAALLAYLAGSESRAVFEAHGFSWRAATPPAATLAPIASGSGANDDLVVLRLSLFIAAIAVLLCLPLGVACGWLLARRDFVGKSVIENLANLPLVLPPAVTGFLLLVLLGRHGPIGSLLYDLFGVQIAFTWFAAALAAAVVSFPLMVQSVRLATESVDPGLEQAARTLGAGPFRVARTITLPLAAPGILAGIVIAFARALGELGATLVFAGNTPGETQILPLAVWSRVSQAGGESAAFRLVVISVAVSYLALFAASRLQRRIVRRTRGL